MNEISIREEDSGKWRIVTACNGGNFDTELDARTAIRLCKASYKAGRHDHAKDLKKLLSE